MRIQLYNDKQVTKIVESIQRQFVINFNKSKDELEAMLDAEIERQVEGNVEVQEYVKERKTDLETILQLVKLNEQVEALNEDYNISANKWKATSISDFTQENYDKRTQTEIDFMAKNAANKALGLDDIDYRERCLNNDLTARVAVMQTVDYDEIVALLNNKINIKDYFVTL